MATGDSKNAPQVTTTHENGVTHMKIKAGADTADYMIDPQHKIILLLNNEVALNSTISNKWFSSTLEASNDLEKWQNGRDVVSIVTNPGADYFKGSVNCDSGLDANTSLDVAQDATRDTLQKYLAAHPALKQALIDNHVSVQFEVTGEGRQAVVKEVSLAEFLKPTPRYEACPADKSGVIAPKR